jgi:hypothetical protein
MRSPWTNESKAEAVATLRRFLYQGRLELPRHPELASQLVSLEQRPLPSGWLRIAAPPGQHDDYATALIALAGHLALALGSWGGGGSYGAATA